MVSYCPRRKAAYSNTRSKAVTLTDRASRMTPGKADRPGCLLVAGGWWQLTGLSPEAFVKLRHSRRNAS